MMKEMYAVDFRETENPTIVKKSARRFLEKFLGFSRKETNLYIRQHPLLGFEEQQLIDYVRSIQSCPSALSLVFEYKQLVSDDPTLL